MSRSRARSTGTRRFRRSGQRSRWQRTAGPAREAHAPNLVTRPALQHCSKAPPHPSRRSAVSGSSPGEPVWYGARLRQNKRRATDPAARLWHFAVDVAALVSRPLSAGGLPVLPGVERRSDPIVVDAEIAVAVTGHGIRPHRLDLLCKHADIDLVAPIVLEAIEADAFGYGADPDHIMLEQDVGPHAAATAATAHAAATAATAHATATAEHAAAARRPPELLELELMALELLALELLVPHAALEYHAT